MDQFIAFFSGILDTSKWPPRWYCGYWSEFHGWLYILSDLVIWAAYMCIPLILIRFIRKKKGVPLSKVFILFGLFILLCGFTHLIDAIIFWEPIYRFSALVRFLTAVVSVATVIALIRYFKEAIGLKTSSEFSFELNYRKQAIIELERSNKDLQDFGYAASHDLQSPINTINSYLSYLQKNYKNVLDEKGNKMISTAVDASDRMSDLVNDLLNYSKVGQNVNYTAIDLTKLVKDVVGDLQSDLQENKIILECQELPTITFDRTDIRRVFSNLIENAIKYQKPGNQPTIKVGFTDNEDSWTFEIKDNGIGIAKEYEKKVFQVFQRLHTRNHYEGTGIGLAMVAKIIEMYGGKIWLKSKLDIGTSFFFTISKHIKLTQDYG